VIDGHNICEEGDEIGNDDDRLEEVKRSVDVHEGIGGK
jgi:hypothetical protein